MFGRSFFGSPHLVLHARFPLNPNVVRAAVQCLSCAFLAAVMSHNCEAPKFQAFVVSDHFPYGFALESFDFDPELYGE